MTMDVPNSDSCFSVKLVIIGVVSLVHFASVATSFQVFSPFVPGGKSSVGTRPETQQPSQSLCALPSQSRVSFLEPCPQNKDGHSVVPLTASRRGAAAFVVPRAAYHRPNHFKLWLASPESLSSQDDNTNVGYDDLYDFLTRQTGEASGEKGPEPTIDQIKGYKGSSGEKSRDGSKGASDLNQPIRLEDGKVDEELVDQIQKNETVSSQTRVLLDSIASELPTIGEMLSDEPVQNDEDSNSVTDEIKRRMTSEGDDDSWFEPERLRIEQEYDRIRQETKKRLRELSRSESDTKNDGDGFVDRIPDDAEKIADDFFAQETINMIDSVKSERERERFQLYSAEKLEMLEQEMITNDELVDEEVADEILGLADDEEETRRKQKAITDRLERYELMRTRELNEDNESLDTWIIDMMNKAEDDDDAMSDVSEEIMIDMLEMMASRLDDEDDAMTEILEENMSDMIEQMEAESEKGPLGPQTKKEWQMYHAIAKSLREEQDKSLDNELIVTDELNYKKRGVDEAKVLQKLDAWREVKKTEDQMRIHSGMNSVPNLPFIELGAKVEEVEAKRKRKKESQKLYDEDEISSMTASEFDRYMDLQAVRALESLSRRRDNLKTKVEKFKEELEMTNYDDVDEKDVEEETPVSSEPVDFTDVFGQFDDEDDKQDTPSGSLSSDDGSSIFSFSGNGAQYSAGPRDIEPPLQNLNIPDATISSDLYSGPNEAEAPTPNSPYFQDQPEQETDDEESILGSADEQKLRSLYRRSDAGTKAEQDELRKNWEDFQAFEKEARDMSGMTAGVDSTLTDDIELDIDLDDVFTEDGDFDAEQILSSISSRRKKRKKNKSLFRKKNQPKTDSSTSSADPLVGGTMSRESKGEGIGGGFLGDEAFDDRKKRPRRVVQGQMGIVRDIFKSSRRFDDFNYDEKTAYEKGDIDADAWKLNLLDYVELNPLDVISLIDYKFSPQVTGVSNWAYFNNKPFKEYGLIFRLEGVLVDITGLQRKVWNRVAGEFELAEPRLEYVKRAANLHPTVAASQVFYPPIHDHFLIRRIADAYRRIFREEFDAWANVIEEDSVAKTDDAPSIDDARFEDESDSAAEKEAGTSSQYIHDVWTKTAKQFGFPAPTNEEIAESSKLTPDVAVRDVFRWSEDQKQINKIVSAYSILQAGGAVPIEEETIEKENSDPEPAPITIENRVVSEEDMILELQKQAWEKVAKENSLEAPEMEDVIVAFKLRNPGFAVVDRFHWTEDPDEAVRLADLWCDYFDELVDQHFNKRNSTPPTSDLSPSSDAKEPQKPKELSEDELFRANFDAWTSIAWKVGYPLPDEEGVRMAMFVGPMDAVTVGFRWTENEEEAEIIVEEYERLMELKDDISNEHQDTEHQDTEHQDTEHQDTETVEYEIISEEDDMPLVRAMPGVLDWMKNVKKQAIEMGWGVVTHLEEDQLNALLDFAGLSDELPSGNRVSHSNGYLRECQQQLGASLRIERRPDRCIVFDSSPIATAAAREYNMRSVSLAGPYTRYDLGGADKVVSALDDLITIDIRHIATVRPQDQPELQVQTGVPFDNQGRRIRTANDFPDP